MARTFMKVAFSIPNEHVGDLLGFLADRGAQALEYHQIELKDGRGGKRNRTNSAEAIVNAVGGGSISSKEIQEMLPKLSAKAIWSALTRLKAKKILKKTRGKWSKVK